MIGEDVHNAVLLNRDNGSVPICSDSRPSEIIAKLQDVYEKILESVDEDAEVDALKLKVSTLQSWVKDLTEQNMLLVETAEQLEKEAAERVSLLEERIRQTSQAALKYMTKLQDYDNQVQDLAGQKINLVSMTLSQEQLQTRVSNLQNDIKNLLDLIQRAKETGSWDLDNLSFKEVVWDDNFVGTLSVEQPQQYTSAEQKIGNKASVSDFEDKVVIQNYQSQISLWKSKALEAEAKIKKLEEDAINKKNTLSDLQQQFAESQTCLDSTLKENEKLCSQIKAHVEQMSLKDKEIEKIKKTILDMERSSKDERAALTAEVAEKHDEIRSLTEKNKQLENRCRDANMQTQLKDDIIKQMRKDIKQLKTETEGHCICKNQTSPEMTLQVTDGKDSEKTTETVDARIFDEQTRIHITHSIKESTPETNPAEVDSLKKELSDTKEELESLKLNQKSKDQMLANQMEMLKVQQDTLNMTQAELKEAQERIKELENMKKSAEDLSKELKDKSEEEKAQKEALAKAEKRNEEQQVTIKNLQEALLSTKNQLEELQGKGTVEINMKNDTIKALHLALSEAENQYIDCYGEVVIKANTVKNLKESNLSLHYQNDILQQELCLLGFFLSEFFIELSMTKEELKQENKKLEQTIEKLERKVSEIQNSLDETEEKYEKIEENNRKFQYEVSLMSQLKEISDQNNIVLAAEIKNLNAEINKLQNQLQRRDSEYFQKTADQFSSSLKGETEVLQAEVRRLQHQLQKKTSEVGSLQLALNKEKNSVQHSKKAYGFANETLKCYLVQTESLYKMKDILQEKSKNLVSQNNILQEEISSLQKELNGANMYCNEVCREFLATVEFVHQWMLKRHTLQSRLTVNLQRKLYVIKNLKRERNTCYKAYS
ncbi:repetitive organellar protein-like isoform X2 [Schistocerca serialis cubense]|uniref:repetitive organellar protein-like isoform X2 n=1 Tax=Schistocerca serialis cubense TaxID=2023355 RepID=UPI00214F586E|nr:repetitive organellar protein-like isoform X2 [Schistocerca serialis cubense]